MVMEALPKYSDDPNEYSKAWMKRKRRLDPAFAQRQSKAARRWQLANPVRNALNQYRQKAQRKSREWDLSQQAFAALVTDSCHYCGLTPESPAINGVDRLDSARGYTEENVVTACAQCNYAKRNQSTEQFLAWAKRLADFQEG
jgi:5-methylcytosine-specific restriction endonuclease McrA